MATVLKKCKVCGCDYEYCHTVKKRDAFRYQDVACCPEHASEYFRMVEEARSGKSDAAPEVEAVVVDTAADSEEASNVCLYEDIFGDDDAYEDDDTDDAEEIELFYEFDSE